MKNTLIFTLFTLLTVHQIVAQNTYVPDDNFEQELIDLGYDSGALDDYVPTANINTITYIGLFSKNITDLTGIEGFAALSILYCTGNPITDLDLSKNTALTSLSYSGSQITNLNLKNGNSTSLVPYISGTPNLICIKVDDVAYANANWKNNVDSNSSFSTECGTTYVPDDVFEQELIRKGYDSGILDDYVPTVSIENITLLNVAGKQITDLTGIEDFAALKQLFVANTYLTQLDVSKNTNLETLSCYSSQITSLDLSKNTALKSLRADRNKLTQLNIKNGNNANITHQNFNASGNNDLTCIQVDDVTYSNTTWFSKDATASYNENCNYNSAYIPDDNFEQALIDLGYDSGALDDYVPIENINTITSLDIASKNIVDLTGIEAFTTLITLNCSSNQIVNLDVSSNTSLVNLQANDNQLESLNFKNGANNTIINSNFNVVNNLNLTCIEVDNATYSTTNWSQIDVSASFSENCHYGQTYVPDDYFEAWLINLGYDTGVLDNYVPTANINTVTTLSLYNKDIIDLTGIEAFTALTTLALERNDIISVDLSKNTVLESINLSYNQLTSLDLSKNTALTAVNIIGNKLTSFNIQNGTNTNITNVDFKATNNPNLVCINVDDVSYSNANWTQIDNATSFSLKCGFTYVPDDNFEQALIDLGYDSGVLDDYVPDATIKILTSLDVSGKNISDFTGIEDFVALTTLNFSDNNLVSVDLSNNTALENLDCSNNQFTSLDVTLLTSLKILTASNNQLTTIDVSKNTSLTNLTLDTNQLTSLDITNNTLLNAVSCKNNVITSLIMVNDNNVLANLDCSNNKIVGLDVNVLGGLIMLNCNNNLITNLDISKNDKLTEFNASNNQLTFLNVKNGVNSNISTANFNTTNNSNLICILVDDVSYATTNWTNINTTTTFSLDCGLAYIPDDNFEKALINLGYDSGVRDNYVPIANINTITSLNLYGKFVSDLTGIEYFTALEDLNCGFNRLTTLDLSDNLELTTLNCSNGQIANLNINKNSKLTSLDCSENNLSNLNVSDNLSLTSLNCSTNYSIQNLDLTLQTKLTYLDCSENSLSTLLLPQNAPIEKLYCNKNSLISLDVSTNTTITNLGCAENDIISLDLKNNTTLHHLNCEYNKLTSLELPKSIIKVDCYHNALTTLDISDTPAMIHLRCQNNQLASLNVANSSVFQLSCNNNQLTSLDLTTTRVIELFASNNNLKELNIKNGLNDRMDDGDFVVQSNRNLTCVQVDDATYSTNTWSRIDTQISFNENCGALSTNDEILSASIFIYPNPTTSVLNINSHQQKIQSIQIFNLIGKQVFYESGANNVLIQSLDISQLKKGIYFLKIVTESKKITSKIVKN